jgi:uncharacterized membrane protein YcgQ (UPF0703/DUF1980 family)
MANFTLFTDSASDVSDVQQQEWGIKVIELKYLLDGTLYSNKLDHSEYPIKDFYAALRNGSACSTSAANMGDFIDALPSFLQVVQIITLVNAETYDMYLANMKQVMMEQYRMSEMVIFNRCTKDSDRAGYRRSVKAVNGRAQVYFESSDGSSNEIQEILPFDVDADVIEIADEDYGLWYMDAMDNPAKYDGKTIKAKVVVYKPKEYAGKNTFAPGRFAMTCCADDIGFIGFKCKYDKEMSKVLDNYKDRDFIYLVAEAKIEYCREYQGKGVVLYATSIEKAEKPEDDLVYFN